MEGDHLERERQLVARRRHRRRVRRAESDRRRGEGDRERDGERVEEAHAAEDLREHDARALAGDGVRVDHPHRQTGEQDEALGCGHEEAVPAGERVEPGLLAADVVDDHHEDADAAKEVDPQVTLAARLWRCRVGNSPQALDQPLPQGDTLHARQLQYRADHAEGVAS